MSVKLTCTMCSKELEVPDSFAGRKGKCPFCGEVLDIPAAGDQVSAGSVPEPGAGASAGAAGEAGQAAAEDSFSQPPAEAPPAAGDSSPVQRPAPAPVGRPPSKLRLSVLLPAALVVAGAVIAAAVYYNSLKGEPGQEPVGPRHGRPELTGRQPDNKAGTQAEAEATTQKTEKEPPLVTGPDRYPDTKRLAAGLSNRVWVYAEVKQPGEFFGRLAQLPIWKDEGQAAERCEAAYLEAIRVVAYRFGLEETDVRDVLHRARALHLAFTSLDEWPVMLVGLGERASRDSLFGKESSIRLQSTFRSGEIEIDMFWGKNKEQLFAGYSNHWAVLAARHDMISKIMERLRTDAPDSLMNSEGFVQALAMREGDGSWLCLVPGSDQDFQKDLLRQALQVNRVTSAQVNVDLQSNRIRGILVAGGALASIMGGSASGALAAYAPEGSVAYVSVAPKNVHDLLLPAGLLGVDPVLAKNIAASLGPELAVVMHGRADLADAAFIAPVADPQRLKTALDALMGGQDLKVSDYEGFTLLGWRNRSIAFGKEVLIAGAHEEVTRACIDAPRGGNLSGSGVVKEGGKGTSATAMVKIAAAAQSLLPPLAEILAEDATTVLAAREQEGVVRIEGDANSLGALAAYFSDAAQKRKREEERLRLAAVRDAYKVCRENVQAIHHAVNLFIADDLDTLQYPRRIKEVIDGGFLDAGRLTCPEDKRPATLPDGVVTSYEFIFNRVSYRLTAGFSEKAIVVWEREANHEGRHTASFVNGELRALSPAELKRAIEEALAEAEKSAPRKVTVPRR